MTPVTFPETNVEIAKDQPEYLTLPSHVDMSTPQRVATFCWQLSWRERWQLLVRGRLWHQVLTFGHPLQPQLLHTVKPQLNPEA